MWNCSQVNAKERNAFDDESTLVQVMAWCPYRGQCRPRSKTPYGPTRPKCVNMETIGNWSDIYTIASNLASWKTNIAQQVTWTFYVNHFFLPHPMFIINVTVSQKVNSAYIHLIWMFTGNIVRYFFYLCQWLQKGINPFLYITACIDCYFTMQYDMTNDRHLRRSGQTQVVCIGWQHSKITPTVFDKMNDNRCTWVPFY